MPENRFHWHSTRLSADESNPVSASCGQYCPTFTLLQEGPKYELQVFPVITGHAHSSLLCCPFGPTQTEASPDLAEQSRVAPATLPAQAGQGQVLGMPTHMEEPLSSQARDPYGVHTFLQGRDNNRCITDRKGHSVAVQVHSGFLVYTTLGTTHQCAGAAGRLSRLAALPPSSSWMACYGKDRQYICGLPYQSPGRTKSFSSLKLAHQLLTWAHPRLLSLTALHFTMLGILTQIFSHGSIHIQGSGSCTQKWCRPSGTGMAGCRWIFSPLKPQLTVPCGFP